MGGQVSTIRAVAAGKLAPDGRKRSGGRGDKAKISILAFEVANVMSKCIVLWQSLSDHEIIRLRTEVIKAEGVLKLVSDSEAVLLSLACREKLQDLMALAGSVARLGKKCHNPALQGFEHVFSDVLKQSIDLSDFEFSVKEMEAKMKKMERYIATTSNLYQELEILADLEQAVRRIQDDEDTTQRDSLGALEQKISWQRQEIKYLRDLSLWNRTYDKIVLLLAKIICTMHSRIVCVFGSPAFDMTEPISAVMALTRSGELNSNNQNSKFTASASSRGSFLQYCNGEGATTSTTSNFVEACNAMAVSSSSPSSDADASPVDSDLRMSAEAEAAASMGAARIAAAAAAAVSSSNGQRSNGYHNHQPEGQSRVDTKSSKQGQELQQENDKQQEQRHQELESDKQQLEQHRESRQQQQNGITRSQQLLQQQKQMMVASPYRSGKLNRLFFDPKFIQHSAPSSTLGGSALALHYANVIIIVEKMVRFPQLVGSDARDDLYRMLPKSLRLGLRSRLRTCFRTTAAAAAAAAGAAAAGAAAAGAGMNDQSSSPTTVLRIDSSTASSWRDKLEEVLAWLAPLAHNMIRWQSEHNFEQQVVSRTNVLLLQTLYFADQLKAEAAIIELLVGLNYLCWYEKEMKANVPLDYAASKELDEYLDWQF